LEITGESKDLHSNIALWLQYNRHLPTEEIVATVKHMLKGAEPTVLLHYAAYSFILKDLLTQKLEADDEVDSARNELEFHRKAEDKDRRMTDLITKAFISITTDHFKTVSSQRKSANSKRGDKYKATEDELKKYWQKNISPHKKATDVAILLERTDIYINSATQPKRSSLERYVREWQVEQK